MLTGVEDELLEQYLTFRGRTSHIRQTLEQFATYDASDVAQLLNDGTGQLGLTALHVSAMRGDVKGVGALLNGGANSSCESKGGLGYITPLELAIAWCPEGRNAIDTVQALLSPTVGYEFEANSARQLSARVGCKTTLLHMAAARKSSAILYLLLSVANINLEVLDIDTRDAYYRTPLHIAAQVGSLDCVELLLGKGANAQLRDYNCLTPHELAQKYSFGFPKDHKAPSVGSDMVYDVLTYGQNLDWGSATDYEAVIQTFNTIATVTQSVQIAPEQPSEPLLFQLPSQLKNYKAPIDNTKPPAFAYSNDQWEWRQMTDYFTGAAAQPMPVDSKDYLHKYSYRATATSIPRESEVLRLSE